MDSEAIIARNISNNSITSAQISAKATLQISCGSLELRL